MNQFPNIPGRPNRPNAPITDVGDIARLRESVSQDPADHLPKGQEYIPDERDNEPLIPAAKHEVPSFIAKELAADPSELMQGSRRMRNDDPLPDPAQFQGLYAGQTEEDAEAEAMIRSVRSQDPRTLLPNEPKRHPMMDRLLSSFGLRKIPVKKTVVGNINWYFRPGSTTDFLIATEHAGLRSRNSPQRFEVNASYMRAALGLVRVEEDSIYDIIGVNLTPFEREALQRDEANPPQALVERTADAIITFFIDSLMPTMLDELARAYHQLFDADMEVASDIVTYNRTHWRFECDVPGCEEVQNRIPTIINAERGEIKSIFCPVHGTPMRPISSLEKYNNSPLA